MKKLLLFFTALIILSCDDSKPYQPDFSTKDGREDFARKAWVMTPEFVKQNLQSPSTAKFPFSDYTFSDPKSDNSIIIKSYVDAQNSFGGTLRETFFINLKFNGGDWSDINNWSLINIRFE